ncbi:cbb3-type cytochrome oxidase assembly protein CcoS [Vineibacter terrae]|uniref:Cbb3-type cytochrome oxidase assembly protein CcoS n=1 Tax=Vineibacter terrae TaxID=2586908 RepID=A0A5C8PW38_9HYPH|nr:cbb3-type cytochrome oxidase assembly protein CcoS [Vineibacter terrae]TXL82255.1 cbb3-type cytochrome oxidase assembly protein CcoS [Vineibacter terrae]
MIDFLYLVPISLGLGVIGLVAFMWSLRSGQYADLDGAAERILFDDGRDAPDAPARAEPDLTDRPDDR